MVLSWDAMLVLSLLLQLLPIQSSGFEDTDNGMQWCRHIRLLPPDLFEMDTCAYCYFYLNKMLLKPKSPLKAYDVEVTSVVSPNITMPIKVLFHNNTPIVDIESPLILDTFVSEGAVKDWTDCCDAAKQCCQKMALVSYEEVSRASWCPPTWDGWQCWGGTAPNTTALSTCPPYIYFLTEPPSCATPLEKQCLDGDWARNTNTGKEWTNYSKCAAATVFLQQRRAYVLIAANALSIVAIVPALIIFASYKQLRVHRIILHQNLFISMLLNGVFVILFNSVVMLNEIEHQGQSLIQTNNAWCRLLLTLTKYSRMTNYMWMFCEGFYLHKLIAAAFAEQKSLVVFYLIGWVFPTIPTLTYTIYRLGWADSKCWVIPEEPWEWTLNGPSLLSLVVNAVFLINIIRVLVTKLRATHAQEPSQYRKAVRATLVLLPLFGLHFVVTIYRPASTGACLWTDIYFYANDILDGIQGFLVALIFCYCNGEVASLVKRSYLRLREEGLIRNTRGSHTGRRRGGSLGRSVVTTHVYSSVPPSPETNCIAMAVTSTESGNLLAVNMNGGRPTTTIVAGQTSAAGNSDTNTSAL